MLYLGVKFPSRSKKHDLILYSERLIVPNQSQKTRAIIQCCFNVGPTLDKFQVSAGMAVNSRKYGTLTRCCFDAGAGHRRRRWTSNKTTLYYCLVFDGDEMPVWR